MIFFFFDETFFVYYKDLVSFAFLVNFYFGPY